MGSRLMLPQSGLSGGSKNKALEEAGIDVPFAALKLYSGLDGNQTLEIIAPDLDEAVRKLILAAQDKIYEIKCLRTVRPFAVVRDVFEALARSDGKLALATDCKGPELLPFAPGGRGAYRSNACGDDVEHGKPDP